MKMLIDGQTLATPEIGRGIGRVFKQLCERLVVSDLSKEWFISIHQEPDLRHFSAAVQRRLRPIIMGESFTHASCAAQTLHYSRLLQNAASEFRIDAYWTPNPLMTNVILPTDLRGVTVFATIYDAIPLVMRHVYLDNWPEHLQSEYRRRLESLPVWADHLIFISESARDDFARFDGRIAAKATVVPVAVDHTRFWPYAAPKRQSKNPYVLFTGGCDPRKNMNKALEAFAQLIKNSPRGFERLRFYVVCAWSPDARVDYEALAERLGVADRLVLTGYVDDETLADLCRGAAVFFFPSRYEGFGLPVLEAMACGVPVVTTRVSAIPEVVGDVAYYCSVDDTQEMARTLEKALREGTTNGSRRQKSIRRAKEFTWAKSAASYSRLFTSTLLETGKAKKWQRQKIAYVSPWPPQRSGVAYYSFEIVRRLKEHVDVTLYLENVKGDYRNHLALPVEKLSSLPRDVKKFDSVIYHVGNHPVFHKEIYKMAWRYPGVVVLHDFDIRSLLAALLNTPDEDLYADALHEGYGEEGALYYQALKANGSGDEVCQFPMSHALAKRSAATIVHNHWAKRQLTAVNNVFVIPLGAAADKTVEPDESDRELRARFGLTPDKFVIAAFGFVNRLKRIPVILEALKILIDRGYPVRFFIGGELLDPSLMIQERIESLGISDNVVVSGYLSDAEFDRCMRLSDIILNLRCPSMGESSASLMKAFGYGKACIVSNYQQFAEFPDSVCWKADVNDMEVPQLVAYMETLLRNPTARKQLGENATFFVEHYCSYDLAAELYAWVLSVAGDQSEIGSCP